MPISWERPTLTNNNFWSPPPGQLANSVSDRKEMHWFRAHRTPHQAPPGSLYQCFLPRPCSGETPGFWALSFDGRIVMRNFPGGAADPQKKNTDLDPETDYLIELPLVLLIVIAWISQYWLAVQRMLDACRRIKLDLKSWLKYDFRLYHDWTSKKK